MKRDSNHSGSEGETLSLHLLSSFQVLRNGEPVNGRLGGKARQLLKILVAHRRSHLPKDLLIEMLWPNGEPGAGATSLKVAVHNLRSALEPEKENGQPGTWLIAENGTYSLNPGANVWIDTETFSECYARARSLESQGKPAEARRAYEQAEEMYTGDFLEEDIYEDWTVIRREELRDLYLDTLSRLAQLALDEGAHADVIRYSHKIVLADPCREDAYRMLMRSHGALNQLARAGAWYAVCKATLLREVDAHPSAETASLFEGLFTGASDTPAARPV